MRVEQLAINSVSTRYAGLEECLAAYAGAGFRNVEFVLSHVKNYLTAGHSLADVRRLLADHELRCIGGFETALFCFAEDARRAENHAAVIANARLLAELGAGALVVGTDGPADLKATPDPVGQIADAFAQVAGEIADTGITLCLEFNWSPVVKSLRTAGEVVRRAGQPNVGILFDPAHYHCTPSKLEQIDGINGPVIRHVHVDDMADKPGELSDCNADRALPGQGCLNLPALFGAVEAQGYKGYFSIEMFNKELWEMPAAEAARRMYASLLPLCEG